MSIQLPKIGFGVTFCAAMFMRECDGNCHFGVLETPFVGLQIHGMMIASTSAQSPTNQERTMYQEYGRTFNAARKAQGFKSQANLDAWFRYYDHTKACAECQKPGRGMPLDDGIQPTMNICPDGNALFKLAYV